MPEYCQSFKLEFMFLETDNLGKKHLYPVKYNYIILLKSEVAVVHRKLLLR